MVAPRAPACLPSQPLGATVPHSVVVTPNKARAGFMLADVKGQAKSAQRKCVWLEVLPEARQRRVPLS